jgi:hypothetical protein
MGNGRLSDNAIHIKNDCIKIQHIFNFNPSWHPFPSGRETDRKWG